MEKGKKKKKKKLLFRDLYPGHCAWQVGMLTTPDPRTALRTLRPLPRLVLIPTVLCFWPPKKSAVRGSGVLH